MTVVTLPQDMVVSSRTMPSLHWDVGVTENGELLTLTRNGTSYHFRGLPADQLRGLVSRLDGRHTITECADAAGVHDNDSQEVLKHLFRHDLAFDSSERIASDIQPSRFYGIAHDLFGQWKSRLFSHPLWVQLATGEASRSQFMGWLIETFHFIEATNARMPMAVAASANHLVARIIAHHYTEEYDHGHFFLKSLEAFGIDKATAQRSRPLPGTDAVINYMRECGRRDCLEYAICSGFLESTGTDREKARDFYKRLTANYASECPDVIQHIADHTDLDEAYGHGDLFESVCDVIDPLSLTHASRILQAAYALVETLEVWSTDIMRSYEYCDAQPRTHFQPYRRH